MAREPRTGGGGEGGKRDSGDTYAGKDAVANTGGGGGGAPASSSGDGGSGIVLVRYPTSIVTAVGAVGSTLVYGMAVGSDLIGGLSAG